MTGGKYSWAEERDKLRAALKPFADFARLSGFDKVPADAAMTKGSALAARQVTASDFVRARQAFDSAPAQIFKGD